MIGINDGMRTPENKFLFWLYKAIRRFHVSVWFYPFPFIIMIAMFYSTFKNSFQQEHVPDYWEHRFDPVLAIPQHCLLKETEIEQNKEELSRSENFSINPDEDSGDNVNENNGDIENVTSNLG